MGRQIQAISIRAGTNCGKKPCPAEETWCHPAGLRIDQRHSEIPAWDTHARTLQTRIAAQMEVYAGFLEYTDYHVGKILDGLKKLDILNDTLVFYIIGDNGASAEGSIIGALTK